MRLRKAIRWLRSRRGRADCAQVRAIADRLWSAGTEHANTNWIMLMSARIAARNKGQ